MIVESAQYTNTYEVVCSVACGTLHGGVGSSLGHHEFEECLHSASAPAQELD